MNLKIIGIGSVLTFVSLWIMVIFQIGYGAWLIFGLIGIYIGWIRKYGNFYESLQNYVYTCLVAGTVTGIMIIWLDGYGQITYCLMLFMVLLFLLIPGVVLGGLISHLIQRKAKNSF